LQFRLLDQINSEDENILALRIQLKNTEVMLISIYGPNNADPGFFNVLSDILTTLNDVPVILGGDWNATLSTDPVQINIDILNMARLPNLNHSNKISELLLNFNLSDLFRFFYLDRKEYSYVPRYNLSQNKSRLDFFLVSDSLLDFTSDCLIHTALQNKLFDHKAVSLFFNKTRKKLPERYAISKKELNNDLLVFLVHATVAETYIQHWVGDRR
jgi:exonuclease III